MDEHGDVPRQEGHRLRTQMVRVDMANVDEVQLGKGRRIELVGRIMSPRSVVFAIDEPGVREYSDTLHLDQHGCRFQELYLHLNELVFGCTGASSQLGFRVGWHALRYSEGRAGRSHALRILLRACHPKLQL